MSTQAPTSDPAFWDGWRMQWTYRLGRGAAAGTGAMLLIVGGLALLARRAGQAWATSHGTSAVSGPSLPAHVGAMLAVAALAVGVAGALVRGRNRGMAVAVLAATVAGPMTVVATPVTASLVTTSLSDTRVWWHVVVALAELAVLAPAAMWVGRCLSARTADPVRCTPLTGRLVPSAETCFVGVLAGGLALHYLTLSDGSEVPGFTPVLGWSALAAGIAVAVARSSRWWPAGLALLAAGAVLGLMVVAYQRSGGWPAVAGWELDGMESPVVLSITTSATLLAAPALGLLLRALRRG